MPLVNSKYLDPLTRKKMKLIECSIRFVKIVLPIPYILVIQIRLFLGNESGTIEEMLSRNQFTLCENTLLDIDKVSSEKKSLRQIATSQSMPGGQGYRGCHFFSSNKLNYNN